MPKLHAAIDAQRGQHARAVFPPLQRLLGRPVHGIDDLRLRFGGAEHGRDLIAIKARISGRVRSKWPRSIAGSGSAAATTWASARAHSSRAILMSRATYGANKAPSEYRSPPIASRPMSRRN